MINTRCCVSFVIAGESWRAGHDKTYTSVYYLAVKKQNFVSYLLHDLYLRSKWNLVLNAHLWPPSFGCALLLSQLNPQQKLDGNIFFLYSYINKTCPPHKLIPLAQSKQATYILKQTNHSFQICTNQLHVQKIWPQDLQDISSTSKTSTMSS